MTLADKIEALTGPDRAVDAEIALAVGIVPDGAFRPSASPDVGTFAVGAYGSWTSPAYTASLDAAMTLVPEGHDHCIEKVSGRHYASVTVEGCLIEERGMGPIEAATPALALCAAALRAKEASNG